MFEREVKFIYDFNSNKVKKLGASATFTELLPLGIHPAILQYISAEIEFRVFEDRQTLLKHSMFDYSGPEIAKHFGKIADEIKKEKSFSTDFLSKVILHATSFNINYLIRPNWSLKKLIFDTNESASVAEIYQILNYTYFYKHITKVVRNFLEKKKLITLSKDEFSQLLEKFDQVSLQSYGKDIIESAIKSIATFFNIGSMNQKGVPVQAIGIFLQEKKLASHLESLQRKLAGENKSKIELNDLRSILLGVPVESVEILDKPERAKEELKIIEAEEPVKRDDESLSKETEELFEQESNEVDEPESGEEFEQINDEDIDEEITESKKAEDLIEENQLDEEVDQQEEESEETNVLEEEDVEIKLRSNKEKEVAQIEEEHEEFEIDEEAENYTLEEEYEDPEDYLGDQSDAGSDIILTVDDLDEEEKVEEVHNELEIDEEESVELEEEIETGEVIELEDENDNLELITDTEEIENDDEEEVIEEELIDEEPEPIESGNADPEILGLDEEIEEEITDEDEVEYSMPPEPEDEYSYPEQNNDDSETDIELGEEKTEEDDLQNDEEIIEDEIVPDEKSIPQATLFGEIPDEELVNDNDEEDFISDFGSQNFSKRIDIADLLENRNMTKIIEVVFDYDMEEFANAIERICESTSRQEAFATLQEIFEVNQVNPTSKEAQSFRDIISEYFDQN